MIKFKLYSIQSGKPKKSVGLLGEFKNKSVRYAPIGALIGAGYGTISEDEGVVKASIKGAGIGILLAALDTALGHFRRKEVRSASADDIISKLRSVAPITPNDYTVNSDPYSSKLSVAISGGIMVMWINNLSNSEISTISDLLDEKCKEDRYSDYKSEVMENNGYLVTIVLPGISSTCELLRSIINDLGIKVNIVSKIGNENKQFSLRDDFKEYKGNKKGFIKSLLKRNKIVRNMEKVTPGITDEVIDDMSVDPLINKYKEIGNGKGTTK